MRYLIKTCMLLAFSSVLPAQQSDIAKIDSTSLNSYAKIISRQDLQRLPFRGESQDYYALFPGTVQQDYRGTEFLHIRGSRHDEIAYSFEGVDVRSAFTGLNMIRFIPEALERITLNMSPAASENDAVALLQHRLRRGGSDFRASLKTETDRFTSNYNGRLGTFSYGYFNTLLTAEGKILKDNIRFFAAGERRSFDDHYRKFWDGFRLSEPDFSFQDKNTGQTLQEFVGADELLVRPGNIPNAASLRYTMNGLISADYSPLKLRLVSALNWSEEQQNSTPILNTFNSERTPEYKQRAGFLSLQADYFGSRDWQGHLQFDYLRSNQKTFDPVFEDNFFLYLDSLATIERGVSYVPGTTTFSIHRFPFSHPGALQASYSKSEENYWGFSGAVQKKFSDHQLKLGGAFQRRTLRQFSIKSLRQYMEILQEFGGNPGSLNEVKLLRVRNFGDVRTIGYDVLGNKISKGDEVHDASRNPQNYSLFLEEQFRAQSVLLNFGIRYASFSSDALGFSDPASPDLEFDSFYGFNPLPSSPASKSFILPRFKAAFFVDEQLSFQFQLGKFVQQPRLRDLYASRAYFNRTFEGAQFINDPRGPNAHPVKSTQTELSVSYRPPNAHFMATLFSKTTDDHLETARINTDPNSPAASYNGLVNSGEANAKGLELSLVYRNKGLYSWLNYTFSDVTGFTSYPNSNVRDAELGDQNGFHSKSAPLDFNQKHRGNALLSYAVAGNASPLFRNTGLHLLFRFNNGHNFNLYEGGFG